MKTKPSREEVAGWTAAGVVFAILFCCLCAGVIAGIVLGAVALGTNNNNNNEHTTTSTTTPAPCPCVQQPLTLEPTFLGPLNSPATVNKHRRDLKYQPRIPSGVRLPKRLASKLGGSLTDGVPVVGGPTTAIYQKTGRQVTFTIPLVNYTSLDPVCQYSIPLSQLPESIYPIANTAVAGFDYILIQQATSTSFDWETFMLVFSDPSMSFFGAIASGCSDGNGTQFTTPTITMSYLATTASNGVTALAPLFMVIGGLFLSLL